MILNSIELINYKSYHGTHTFNFDKINLIVGANYIGKSTICNAIKFCLYGDAGKRVSLADLPTRGLATTCAVTTNWSIGADKYTITRKVPTETTVHKNGVKIKTGTPSQTQIYINDLFGTNELFKKFRMIDTREGINILEGSELDLKKTLFANEDDSLSKARTQLLNKINEIEKYLSSQKTVSIHYPSTKRRTFLETSLKQLQFDETATNSKVSLLNKQISNSNSIVYSNNNIIATANNNRRKLSQDKVCPECRQVVVTEKSDELLAKYVRDIELASAEVSKSQSTIKRLESELVIHTTHLEAIRTDVTRCKQLLYKLSLSFKRDATAKYTERDLILAKASLAKFDEFGSYYIKRQLEYIEPIINEIAGIVDIQVRFSLTDKNQLSVEMVQNDVTYSYEDISEAQKLTIGIAFKLAILIRDGKYGLVISDEGCSCLDNNNLRKIFGMFQDTEFQLVSVVHRAEDLDNVNIIDLNEIRKSSIILED